MSLANVNPSNNMIETRRIGEYGHFVSPLSQLAADVQEFLAVDLRPYLSEVHAIRRDEQGVHPEEAGILYLLFRARQPVLALETGTFKGYSTAEIARALRLNGAGHLITVDLATQTGAAVPPELLPFVTFHRGERSEAFAQTMPREQRLGIFFHDSLHTYLNALGELIWFADHYVPGAVIVCHDAKMDYLDDFGVGKAVRMFAARLGVQYRILDTTCGLAILKWPAEPPVQALASLRDEYGVLQRLANEGRIRKVLRRLTGF
jgi:hypothetical protein